MAYAAQMFRALEYLHGGHSVCHRDIKPSNLLVDRDKRELRLCDFGNAIVIEDGGGGGGGGSRKNSYSSYVCSRFYRAPGLLHLQSSAKQRALGCVIPRRSRLWPQEQFHAT